MASFPPDSTAEISTRHEPSRRSFIASVGAGLAGSAALFSSEAQHADYTLAQIPLKDVSVKDSFWSPRIERARTVSLPMLLGRAEGSRGNFGVDGRLIEAASYFLIQDPDPALRNRTAALFDRAIENMRARKGVWANRGDGPFFAAGHFFEAAVAYQQATGDRKLLDAAIEIGDDLDATFGPNKRYDISNHEGIEIGLVKLYRATKHEKYLGLAKFIVDTRGTRNGGREMFGPYAQDYVPVKEQTRAIGHCVRATYLYNAVTDLAALTNDPGYGQAARTIWEDAVSKRTFLTGGIGSYRHEENYGDDYDLPNAGCWNEICAAVGNTLWNERMFLLTGDSKYVDVMERILYNGLLAGVSLGGDKFFYQTPLKTFGSFERQHWFGPNCCPPNITRLMGEFAGLIYAHDNRRAYVNLYVASAGKLKLNGTAVTISQETNYPWDGRVKIRVNPDAATRFAVCVRIPGWARNQAIPGDLYHYASAATSPFSIEVNGKPVRHPLSAGYVSLEREWKPGDEITLSLPMAVRRVQSRNEIVENRGMVAFERGPLVYCAEAIDNGDSVFDRVVADNTQFNFAFRQDLLDGIGTLTGKSVRLRRSQDHTSVTEQDQDLVLIPYFAFGNRAAADMAVWLPGEERKAVIAPQSTLASTSRASSSCGDGTVADNYPGHKPPTIAQRLYTNSQDGSGQITAIYDQVEPPDSEDGSGRYLRLRPQTGDEAWVQYDFAAPARVSSVSVYWKDDKQYCVLPKGWTLLYLEQSEWKPVQTSDSFSVAKDKFNDVTFTPVTTSGLRIVIQLQPRTYQKGKLGPPDANYLREDLTWFEGGLIEWKVNKV